MITESRLHERCGAVGLAGARPFSFSGTPKNFESALPFRTTHLSLDLALDFAKKSVRGRAILSLERVDKHALEVELDAVAFTVKRVTVKEKSADYVYDGQVLRVRLGAGFKEGKLAVEYEATPRRGLYFLEPDEHVTDRPRQAWTQCQEQDARHFFPCQDHPRVKATVDVRVQAPAGFDVLSNGKRISRRTPRGRDWTHHWSMPDPIPSYLLTIAVGEFSEITDDVDGLPISYLVPKGREEDGARSFARTPAMIRFFSKMTGVPFPWNKYAQVVVSDFIFGGMENTTATTMYEYVLLDERAALDVTSDDLIAHELAHHWFGDYVTCRDWSEGWLNEGFATFFEHLWTGEHLGKDEYDVSVFSHLEMYLEEARGRYVRPIVCRQYDAPLDLFDRHLYEKGGLVLHLLRRELGEELFHRGIRCYLEKHAHSIVETRDLMRAFEDVSGRSLGKFFDQWVYQPGHPELEVRLAWERGTLLVQTRQTHRAEDGVPRAFEFPLLLCLVDARGQERLERLTVKGPEESFAVVCRERPLFVVVDPELEILGDVSLKVPNDWLHAQLRKGKTARGRWLAARALAHADDALSLHALAERLQDAKEFWSVRAHAAESLGSIRSSDALGILIKNTSAKHPKVRRAVAAALGQFKLPAASDALKPLAMSDASYLVQAEAARSLGKSRQMQAYDVLVDLLERRSWADVVQAGALQGLAALRDERAVSHVVEKTRYGQPGRARRAAVSALARLLPEKKGREILEDLLGDREPQFRTLVARALVDIGDVRARPVLQEQLESDLDPRVRRVLRESLRDLGGESKKSLEQLKEELDKVRTEQAELRTRLSKLEAGGGSRAARARSRGKTLKKL